MSAWFGDRIAPPICVATEPTLVNTFVTSGYSKIISSICLVTLLVCCKVACGSNSIIKLNSPRSPLPANELPIKPDIPK